MHWRAVVEFHRPRTLMPQSSSDISTRKWPTSARWLLTPRVRRSHLHAPSSCTFAEFQPLTVNDVTAAIRLLPDKHCASNPIPSSLLKDCAYVLAPLLYNTSLRTRSVPNTSNVQSSLYKRQRLWFVSAPLIRSRLWRFINLLTYLLITRAAVEESWLGSGRQALLSADIQLVSPVQAAQAPSCLTAFGLSYGGETPACMNYSRLNKHFTPRKLQFWRSWRIFGLRWIPTTWLYRRCSICQQRLSRSTTLLYCDASRRQCRTALAVLC